MANSLSCRSVGCDKVFRCYSHVLCQNYRNESTERESMGKRSIFHVRFVNIYSRTENSLPNFFVKNRFSVPSSKMKQNVLEAIPSTINMSHLPKSLEHNLTLNLLNVRNFHTHRCNSLSRFMSTGPGRTGTHYYDVLGISSKSTQKQIKTAYYVLSKKYHPDVSEDKKSHALFMEINEAYEVLGNIQKRRMYDRGMFNQRDHRVYEEEEEDYTQSYKSKARQSPFERGDRPPPPTGRSRIYNFDEFYKQHYNELRDRRFQEFKQFQQHRQRDEFEASRRQGPVGSTFIIPLCLTTVLLMIMIFNDSYDSDYLRHESKSRG